MALFSVTESGLPGMEYASFAGLLLLVLYWTQARISSLDKQHEEREKRQDAINAELQRFIHDRMHAVMLDLHQVMQRQCDLTTEFRGELEAMRITIQEMRK